MNNLWKIFVVSASLGVALFLGSQSFAATPAPLAEPKCGGGYGRMVEMLSERFEETSQGNVTVEIPGIGPGEAELFASEEGGTYTLIVKTDPDAGCMIGYGTDWKPGDEVGLFRMDSGA
jgi:hypothetical protein